MYMGDLPQEDVSIASTHHAMLSSAHGRYDQFTMQTHTLVCRFYDMSTLNILCCIVIVPL